MSFGFPYRGLPQDVKEGKKDDLHIHLFHLRSPIHDELEPGLHIFPHERLDRGFRSFGIIDSDAQ
jgi:hypothetical protein